MKGESLISEATLTPVTPTSDTEFPIDQVATNQKSQTSTEVANQNSRRPTAPPPVVPPRTAETSQAKPGKAILYPSRRRSDADRLEYRFNIELCSLWGMW